MSCPDFDTENQNETRCWARKENEANVDRQTTSATAHRKNEQELDHQS